MSYRTQISIEEAIAIVQARAPSLPSESLALEALFDRILTEELVSLVDHPSSDNSALDGYACRERDTLAATKASPVALEVVGDVPAGRIFKGVLQPGTAVSIYTGASIPEGADAIVGVEYTERQGKLVQLFVPASPSHVRARAQDLRQGETTLPAGTRLTPAAMGVLVSMGYPTARVTRQPRVGILSTGDEVIEPGQSLRPGQVYNANAYSVAGLVRQAGGFPLILPRVRDDPTALAGAISQAGQLDLLVTSGGVSMGKYDFVRDLLLHEGTVHFWKVAVRPGGPAMFGDWRGLPVFGLPGNPVSSMVIFELITRAWLQKALGATEPLPYYRRVIATAEDAQKGAGYKTAFRRVLLSFDKARGYLVRSTGEQGSNLLTSMLHANALAIVPPHRDIGAGERLEVIPLS